MTGAKGFAGFCFVKNYKETHGSVYKQASWQKPVQNKLARIEKSRMSQKLSKQKFEKPAQNPLKIAKAINRITESLVQV